jgi:ApbE superfamily uncharacterized protein (UPF0280 family)
MPLYTERTYRGSSNAGDLVSFHMKVKETDLWVSAEQNLEKETRDLVLDCRQQLESHIRMNPGFATSLLPRASDPYAPKIVNNMIEATKDLSVGPMASVAGAVAQYVGEGLLRFTDQVIVENGGDIFLKTNRPATVSIFAGSSPLSEKLGLKIPVKQMPLGVCSSSAKVGHSLSMGITDVCCILSFSAVFADGAATALGNRVKSKEDLESVAEWAGQMAGIIGGVVIVDDRIAAWGEIELVDL